MVGPVELELREPGGLELPPEPVDRGRNCRVFEGDFAVVFLDRVRRPLDSLPLLRGEIGGELATDVPGETLLVDGDDEAAVPPSLAGAELLQSVGVETDRVSTATLGRDQDAAEVREEVLAKHPGALCVVAGFEQEERGLRDAWRAAPLAREVAETPARPGFDQQPIELVFATVGRPNVAATAVVTVAEARRQVAES